MTRGIRPRFWWEAAASLVTVTLAVITLVWQNWIELVLRVDPDHGSGSLERVIVASCALLGVVGVLLARGELKRATVLPPAPVADR